MKMRSSNKKIEKKEKGQIGLYMGLSVFTLICLLPILLIVIVSFSSKESIFEKGFSFFPTGWSMAAYEYVGTFKEQLLQSYLVTIAETVVGTALSLVVVGMFAYTLSRKDFMLRRFLSIYMLITMLLHGGLLSSYLINTNVYHLRDNFLILILPTCVSASNCIIMRTYVQSNVPDSLIESAVIDGAGEVTTFFKIVLPLMKPALASVGFMIAIAHWNEWMPAMLYIDDNRITTLQLMLIRIEENLNYLQANRPFLSAEELEMANNAPTEPARMAILLCTLGPIMVIYPFFQKYFIKGITMGAVKG